jgi:hypothetical protein
MHCSKVLKTKLLHALRSRDGSASRVVSIGLCPRFRAKPGYARKSKTDAGNAAKGFAHNAAASAPHYIYDLNGNLTQDKHKNLTLSYNYLNLPQSFVLTGGTITMTYTADGEKLSKAAGANTKNYVSGIEYTGANLEAIYHAEGRLTPNGGNFYYEYTLKDHLGNARASFRANGAAVTFLEETHYYPFGMQMEGLSTAPVTTNGYKYNSKEWNNDFGLGLYDYGAHFIIYHQF